METFLNKMHALFTCVQHELFMCVCVNLSNSKTTIKQAKETKTQKHISPSVYFQHKKIHLKINKSLNRLNNTKNNKKLNYCLTSNNTTNTS